ncbi:hypothetical protein NIES4071_59480 [Calothrix sp. NIES-4071]|nr:hypothetical protein NIES4071_59480 [Calothrix sp. NIES-4071]BAZ60255.1 hypothetical protein NIES4105_59430 [Calothrix sp. NIES-4105]
MVLLSIDEGIVITKQSPQKFQIGIVPTYLLVHIGGNKTTISNRQKAYNPHSAQSGAALGFYLAKFS